MILAQSQADCPSLWLTVGLPLLVVLLSQIGAVAVTLVATTRSRAVERERFLHSERRAAYAAHIRAAERLRDALSKVLFTQMRRGRDLEQTQQDVDRAQEVYETALSEAALLGTDEYLAASDALTKVFGDYYKRHASLFLKAASIGPDDSVIEVDEVDDITSFALNHGRDEIEALRETARREVRA